MGEEGACGVEKRQLLDRPRANCRDIALRTKRSHRSGRKRGRGGDILEEAARLRESGISDIRSGDVNRVSIDQTNNIRLQKTNANANNTRRAFEVTAWEEIPEWELIRDYKNKFFDSAVKEKRNRVQWDDVEPGTPLYDKNGAEIQRQDPVVDVDEPCGVMMNLKQTRALFAADTSDDGSNDSDGTFGEPREPVKTEVYPLGFLRVVGNVQAKGAPYCLLAPIKKVNESVRKEAARQARESSAASSEEYSPSTERQNTISAVKATSCQFYNYIAHRIAPRAGKLDSQQGLVTAALTGAFAQSETHKKTAKRKQEECKKALPAETFQKRINGSECPTSCRAEIVYTVDVSNLKHQDGRCVTPKIFHAHDSQTHRYIFNHIVVPLSRIWKEKGVLDNFKEHLVIIKPMVRTPAPTLPHNANHALLNPHHPGIPRSL